MVERHEHLADQEQRLYDVMPPLDPESLHWLSSDATFSYCYPCARKARLEEMGLATWPDAGTGYTWERTVEQDAAADLERELEEGIDGWFDSSPSDSPESCETCGRTLRHTLTDYGVIAELDHFASDPGFGRFGPEDSYTVSRICLNLTWSGAPTDQVEAAIVIVEDGLKAVADMLAVPAP